MVWLCMERNNNINVYVFAAALRDLLTNRRGKGRNIIIYSAEIQERYLYLILSLLFLMHLLTHPAPSCWSRKSRSYIHEWFPMVTRYDILAGVSKSLRGLKYSFGRSQLIICRRHIYLWWCTNICNKYFADTIFRLQFKYWRWKLDDGCPMENVSLYFSNSWFWTRKCNNMSKVLFTIGTLAEWNLMLKKIEILNKNTYLFCFGCFVLDSSLVKRCCVIV